MFQSKNKHALNEANKAFISDKIYQKWPSLLTQEPEYTNILDLLGLILLLILVYIVMR